MLFSFKITKSEVINSKLWRKKWYFSSDLKLIYIFVVLEIVFNVYLTIILFTQEAKDTTFTKTVQPHKSEHSMPTIESMKTTHA